MNPHFTCHRAVLAAALAAPALLGACAPLLIGGAIVGGSMVAIDRRTSGTQIDDEAIELKSITRVNDAIGGRGRVSATSYNRMVLISGQVPAETDRVAVEQAIGRIDNVRGVYNELQVAAPSSLSERSNDTLITGKVKASLVDARDLQANVFKVVTERGTVYLMGRVSEREAARAAEVARGVSGVARVVRTVEVVSEAELASGRAAPAVKP